MRFRPLGIAPAAALVLSSLASLMTPAAHAQSISPTSFTYQGRLTDGEAPASGPVTMGFTLYADATGGSPLAPQLVVNNVTPDANGAFSVPLDFASTFFRDGTPRYVELAVIEAGNTQVTLSPRQAITPAPLASGIAGLTILPGGPVLDVDQTAGSQNSTYCGGGAQLAYQSFTANTSGTLQSLAFRLDGASFITLYGSIFHGSGTNGQLIDSFGSPTTSGANFADLEVDVSSLNIQVEAGEVYTVSILCGTEFETVSSAAPGASGRDIFGDPVNFWFQAKVRGSDRVEAAIVADRATLATNATHALTADSASLATTAVTAVTATNATTAATANALDATATSALRDYEMRLRGASDSNHGLGWFGGSASFRNSGVAPDGPVLFGAGGGALATYNAGSNTSVVALRWNSSGQVGIGTAPSSSNYRLELPNTSGPAGQGRANAWVTYSSRAYKHNIETIRDPLDIVSQLRGVRFDWNAPTAEGLIKHDVGFIAEEIAQVLPDLVSHDADGNATGLDYGRVVPVAIEAIKQQQAQIQSLRDQAAAREAENAQLRARLDQLEQRLDRLNAK